MGTDIIFTALMQKGEPMDDLISRQALCRYALNQKDKSVTPNDIMRFPSADRPTGEWINREKCQVDEDAYEVATCSECGAEITIEYPYDNYCPNCGAKMKGDKHE